MFSDEERLKVGQALDWVLPVNAVSKIVYKKSLYPGDTSKLGGWDAVDLAASVPVIKGAKLIKTGAKMGLISKLFGKAVKGGIRTGAKKNAVQVAGTGSRKALVKTGLKVGTGAGLVGSGVYLGGKAVKGAGGAIDRYFETGSTTIPQSGAQVTQGGSYPGFWSGLGALPSGVGEGVGGGFEAAGQGVGNNIIPLAIVGAVAYVVLNKPKRGRKA